MTGKAKWSVARLGFAAVAAVLVVLAFLRGNHLLGVGYGIACVAIALSLLWLFARSLVLAERPSLVRAAVVALLSVPVGLTMAYPASVAPDIRHVIEKQATDRAARAELAAVFASDLAFSDLRVSTTHLKVVNLTIHGSLGDRSDLDRLRDRIAGECAAVNRCVLHWNVVLRNSSQRVDGLDSVLFDAGG